MYEAEYEVMTHPGNQDLRTFYTGFALKQTAEKIAKRFGLRE